MNRLIRYFFLAVLALQPIGNAFGGLITSVQTGTGFFNAGLGQVQNGSLFTMDVFASDAAGGGSVVGYFNLQIDIVNVGGTSGLLKFATIPNQLLGTANDFRTGSNYIFNANPGQLVDAGRNTNSLFFSNLNAGQTSIRITDGVIFNPPLPNQTDLAVTGPKLLWRLVLQADPTMTNLDQYRVTVNAAQLPTNSLIVSNDPNGAHPNFTVNNFGFFNGGDSSNGISYGIANPLGGPVNSTQSLIITAVPEPSSMGLLGVVAVAGVGFRLRKRFGRKVA